jgi:hypothetical protein
MKQKAEKGSSQVEQIVSTPGYDALWGWFGLSYSSYLVIPRVLLHEMPDEWQGKMAKLLQQYDEMFPNQPNIGTRVQITQNGKLIKTPDWLIKYRHPDYEAIKKLKAC